MAEQTIHSSKVLLPINDTDTIIELILDKDTADVVFESGYHLRIIPTCLQMISKYRMNRDCRITSRDACFDWCNDKIWVSILEKIERVNFFGHWHSRLLQNFISHMKELRRCSFVYWKVNQVEYALQVMTYGNLCEFVMHVNGTHSTNKEIVEELNNHCGSGKTPRLERIMLISSEPLEDPRLIWIHDFLGSIHPKASVVLLYGSERNRCMDTMLNYDFSKAGMFRMASNSHIVADETIKEFEIYHLFEKRINNILLTVGCRPGIYDRVYPEIAEGHWCQPVVVENGGEWPIKIYHHSQEEHRPPPRIPTVDFNDLTRYDRLIEDRLVEPITFQCQCSEKSIQVSKEDSFHEYRNFGVPAFDITIIQRCIYGRERTEYQLSHGLYITLPEPKDDYRFMDNNLGACRLTMSFLSQDRVYVVTPPLRNFSRLTEHIVFQGKIWSDVKKEICGHISKSVKALTMMNMKADRAVIIKSLEKLIEGGMGASKSVTRFQLDARDTVEKGLASVIYAIKKIKALDEIFIIVRTMSEQLFKTSLDHAIDDLDKKTNPGATITFVVGSHLKENVVKDCGFKYVGKCIIPCMYSSRGDNGKDIARLCYLHQLEKNGKVWKLIHTFK